MSLRARSDEQGGGAWGVMPFFGLKLRNTLYGMGRCTCKSHIMKWANKLSLQKNSLKLNAASHTITGTLIQMGS